jgi:hypothetical protein
MSRFTTSRVRADRCRVGTVLYNGGRVTRVERNANGTVTLTHQWGKITALPDYRFTVYKNLFQA